jgi:SOS-response transcriptional repressor LexA
VYNLTKNQTLFVNSLIEWYRTNDVNSEPDIDWLRRRLPFGKTLYYRVRNELIEKDILDPKFSCRLTATIRQQMEQAAVSIRITTPVHLPLVGHVKAGRAGQYELKMDLSNLRSPTADTRAIPYPEDNSNAFLLEVVGNSMVHEGIQEGDYLIVEPYPRDFFPRQRELIVTNYLPQVNEGKIQLGTLPDESLLEGPTVKYYTYVAGSERPYRLSWRRDIERSEFTIETKYIAVEQTLRVLSSFRSYQHIRRK